MTVAVIERKITEAVCDWCGTVVYSGPSHDAPSQPLTIIGEKYSDGIELTNFVCDDCASAYRKFVRSMKHFCSRKAEVQDGA